MIAPLFALTVGASSTPTLTPREVYVRVVTTMHAIETPPYLRFDAEVRFTHGSKVVDRSTEDFERTEDRRTFVRPSGGAPGTSQEISLPIPPDLFLGHSPPSALPSPTPESQLASGLDDTGGLKNIATVQAINVHYVVDALPLEDLPNCAEAIHLRLEPMGDPLRYNLRELWIDPATFRICRAIAVWRAPVITHDQDVSVLLDVDSGGYVTHWEITATARVAFGSYTVRQDVYFSSIEPINAAIWKG